MLICTGKFHILSGQILPQSQAEQHDLMRRPQIQLAGMFFFGEDV
jgi:hypothetical protein